MRFKSYFRDTATFAPEKVEIACEGKRSGESGEDVTASGLNQHLGYRISPIEVRNNFAIENYKQPKTALFSQAVFLYADGDGFMDAGDRAPEKGKSGTALPSRARKSYQTPPYTVGSIY